MRLTNPHFDEQLIVWSDKYSGKYFPPPKGYSQEFELQWKIALEGNQEYFNSPGVSTDNRYVEDRVYEWTGKHPNYKGFRDSSCGSRVLDNPINSELIRNKKCIDIGCGMGRWTRAMQFIGAASVLSIDISKSAINSVKQFNSNVLQADIMSIPDEHLELCGQFDFANFWGVSMCTHDPYKAFMSAASTVKLGGAMYLMVYSPEGMHNTNIVNIQRKIFHSMSDIQTKLMFVDHVYNRDWDGRYPFFINVKNVLRNLMGRPKGSKIVVLDMLEPYYNWTIPLDVIRSWMRTAGFDGIVHLNEHERRPCAYHILGLNKST